MHTVIETAMFLNDCRNLSEEERLDIVIAIAADPLQGDIMPGTGGARKRRFPGRGKGKSGGYRIVSYYAADDVPIVALALINKGERADLSKAERNELSDRLSRFAETYRAGAKRNVRNLRKTS